MSESPRQEADSSTGSIDKEVTECPTCGDEFSSTHGMKIHHSHIHDESIAGVPLTCDECGDEFRVQRSDVDDRRHCSDDCKSEWMSRECHGENARNWKEDNTVERVCEYCQSKFEIYRHEFERDGYNMGRFCSTDCHDKWRSENWVGENNPLYKGGEAYYGPNWLRQRRKAIIRDQCRCQDCGKNATELEKEPSVHHIQPIRKFKKKYDKPEWHQRANRIENLVTLCRSCHARWEGVPVRPQPHRPN